MEKLSLAQLARPTLAESAGLARAPLVLVLDDIRSMANVGSIFRTADAFRLGGLWLCGYTPQPPHRDIHKTALGAEASVPWHHAPSAAAALSALAGAGYLCAALEQTDTPTWLHAYHPRAGQKIALVLGNEVEGVSAAALACCMIALEIGQGGVKHSLNVAVAAGVAAFALTQYAPNS